MNKFAQLGNIKFRLNVMWHVTSCMSQNIIFTQVCFTKICP